MVSVRLLAVLLLGVGTHSFIPHSGVDLKTRRACVQLSAKKKKDNDS